MLFWGLAHSSLCGSTMARRYTISEDIDYICDCHTGEEERSQETDSEGTLVSYCPKKRKNVFLMTTLHRDAAVITREDKKPNAILDYNRNKGGVDNLDKVCWFLFFMYFFSIIRLFELHYKSKTWFWWSTHYIYEQHWVSSFHLNMIHEVSFECIHDFIYFVHFCRLLAHTLVRGRQHVGPWWCFSTC